MALSYLHSTEAAGELANNDSAALMTANHSSTNGMREAREVEGIKGLGDLPDELLLQVLSQVPVEARVGIRAVSKKWHSIILDLGYHIEPDFMIEHWGPHYPSEIHMKTNPAIDQFDTWVMDHGCFNYAGRIDAWSLRKMMPRSSEFITSPPVSVLNVLWIDPIHGMRCVDMTIRTATPACKRSEGIRISDLLEVLEKVGTLTSVDRWVLWITLTVAPKECYQNLEVCQPAVNSGFEVRREL